MKDFFYPHTDVATSLKQVHEIVLPLLKELQNKHESHRIGYVAGIVASDGVNKIPENLGILAEHTQKIREQNSYPILCASDIFSPESVALFMATGVSRRDFEYFWKRFLESGYITDIFMTPRWQNSRGATQEHADAQHLKIAIHYLEDPQATTEEKNLETSAA